jgi:endonuclease YncB( thermonuclease family)
MSDATQSRGDTGTVNMQKELLDVYEQASRAWLARVKSEVDLWAELAAKLSVNSFVKDRNRSIECEVKEEADAVLLRLCRAGTIELNHWLLGNGWAELEAGVSDPVLIAAERTARQNFLGIWGNGGFPTGRRH